MGDTDLVHVHLALTPAQAKKLEIVTKSLGKKRPATLEYLLDKELKQIERRTAQLAEKMATLT